MKFKGCTTVFAPEELKIATDTVDVDFQSDVFSLGKTFLLIINRFEKVNPNKLS